MAIDFNKTNNTIHEIEPTDYAPSIEMGIKHAPTKLIVKYLTDMYTSPHEAAIRETVSNALDASIKNGHGYEGVSVNLAESCQRNIDFITEKTDPHSLVTIIENIGVHPDGWVIVSDNGAGMTEDDLVNVYTQYGVSNKRNDDNATGAFGLGAKAPLAYCNEMYVLTKSSEDMKCRFVTCYRTNDDTLVADAPVIIDTKKTITHYRDSGFLTPKKTKAAKTEHITIHDVIGETSGTIVMFPTDDTTRTNAVLRDMATLIYGCNHSKIYNKINKNYKFIELPSTIIEDSNGKKIEAKTYIHDHDFYSFYQSRTITDMIDWACGDKTPSVMSIGFKIGDWFYPTDGTWTYDQRHEEMPYYSNLIIEVPSAALSFVPSRDAILENANSSAIIEAVRGTMKTMFENPDEIAKFLEDTCTLRQNFYQTKTFASNPLHSLSMEKYIYYFEKDDNTLRIERDKNKSGVTSDKVPHTYNLTINLNKLHGIAGKTFTDMIQDEPSIMFPFTYNKNGALIAQRIALVGGPLVASHAYDTSSIIGKNHKNQFVCLANKQLKGLAIAGAKTAADKLRIGEFHHINCSTWKSRDKCSCTAYVSQSLALTNIDEWMSTSRTVSRPKIATAVIIDGSQTKVSRIRASLSRLLDQKVGTFSEEDGNALCCIIPPASYDRSRKEIDAQISDLKNMLEIISSDVIYVDAEELEKLLSRPKEKVIDENEELKKLVHNSTLLTDEGNYLRNSANAWKQMLMNKDKEFALLMLNNANKDAASEFVSIMRAYDLFPKDRFLCVIAVNEKHVKKSRIEQALETPNITVLYDELYHTEEALISDKDLYIVDPNAQSKKYVYKGEITENIRAIKLYEIATTYCNKIITTFGNMWNRSYFALTRLNNQVNFDDISSVANIITNGKININRNYFKHYNPGQQTYPGGFTNVRVENAELLDELNEAMTEVKIFEDYIQIWKHCSEAFGISLGLNLDYKLCSSDYKEFLHNLGNIIGAYEMCDAYQAGVPINDLFPKQN